MALSNRVAKIEATLRISAPDNIVVRLWWQQMLAAPKENETGLDAAFLMAINGVIPQPSSALCQQLEERFQGDVKRWPEERLWFAIAYSEPEHEALLSPEAGNALCYLSLAYWNTFHAFPWRRGGDREAYHKLQERFLGPLFWRLHDLHRLTDWTTPAWSFAAFTSWLKSELVVEVDDLFQSLLDWIGGRKWD